MNLNQPAAPAETATLARDLPILYIKTGCPWCEEVVGFLSEHGIGYREKNVSQDPAALEEMKAKSGQTKAPTLDWHGKILADFGVQELKPFLRKQDVEFEDS
jgi:glutaredoxin 3